MYTFLLKVISSMKGKTSMALAVCLLLASQVACTSPFGEDSASNENKSVVATANPAESMAEAGTTEDVIMGVSEEDETPAQESEEEPKEEAEEESVDALHVRHASDAMEFEVIQDSFLYSSEEALRKHDTADVIRPLKKGDSITCFIPEDAAGKIEYLVHDNGYVDLVDIGYDDNPIVAILFAKSDQTPIYEDDYCTEIIAYCDHMATIGITGAYQAGGHSPQIEKSVYVTYQDGKECYLEPEDFSVMQGSPGEAGVIVYVRLPWPIKATPEYEGETIGFISYGDEITLLSENDGISYISSGGVTGYVYGYALTVIESDRGYPLYHARWKTSRALYQQRDTSSEVLVTIPAGEGATEISPQEGWTDEGEWGAFEYNGIRGYILWDYASDETDYSNYITIKGTTVNVRSGPSTDAAKIGSVKKGEEYSIEGIGFDETLRKTWWIIDYKGQDGYVLSDYAE